MAQPVPTMRDAILAVYEQLPPGEQKLADTILERLRHLASYSATELAAEAAVSKATAARFFRRIGYASFGHARQQARAEAHLASPLLAMAGMDPAEPATDALSRHLAHDLRNLTESLQGLDTATLLAVVRALAQGRSLRVVGLRNGQFIAQHLAYLLSQLRDGVRAIPGPALTLAEDLATLQAGDVVFVVDLRRRSRLLADIVAAARAAGATLVFLTSPGMPALWRSPDLVLRCITTGASIFDSYVAALSIANYLGGAVARELGPQSRQRLEAIERMHALMGDIRG